MNASYKIVLLGAFMLFAAVVGYYVFWGGEDAPDDFAGDDNSAAQVADVEEPAPEPRPEPAPIRPRPTLVPPPVTEAPVPVEETIGDTSRDLPEAPVISGLPDDDALALGEPTDDRRAPAADPTDDREADPPAPVTEEEVGTPDDEPRRAPTPDPADTPDDATETETETEIETETVTPPARPVPPAPGTIPRNYTVQSGDTFASIAAEFYGEERAWFAIAQANPSVDPKRLQVGQVIVLPNRDTDVREREEVRPPAPGKDQTYTIRPGDNLSRIAVRFYGDAEKWDLIYARNRQRIGARPDALKVGMELVIPQAYEGAQ